MHDWVGISLRERVHWILSNLDPQVIEDLGKENIDGVVQMSTNELMAKYEVLKVELQGKNCRINTLEKEKTQLIHTAKQEQVEADRKSVMAIASMESKYKQTTSRNLEMIEKLLGEKKQFEVEISSLKLENSDLQSKIKAKVVKQDELLSKEIEKQKERLMALDKQNRIKWESKKISEIKESTIKQ